MVLSCCVYAQTSLAPSEALKVVKSIEKNQKAFQWKVDQKLPTTINITQKQDSNDSFPVSMNFSYTTNVWLDMQSRQYKIHFLNNSPSKNELLNKESAILESVLLYDGNIYTGWEKIMIKTSHSNPITIMEGSLTPNYDDGRINKNFTKNFRFIYDIGLTTGIPTLFEPFLLDEGVKYFSEYLSTWITSNKVLSITKSDDGKTFMIYAQIHPGPMSHYITKIVYDIEKGGTITNHSVLLSYSKESGDGKVYADSVTECAKNIKNHWVPVQTKIIFPLMKYEYEISYSSFECISKISKNDLSFQFPDGTYVDDYITKAYYKVGNLIDEDKAIDAFILRHGLTGNVPVKTTSGGIVRYVLIAVGSLMIAFGSLMIIVNIVLHFRKKRQS
jgi:hypothetical protein